MHAGHFLSNQFHVSKFLLHRSMSAAFGVRMQQLPKGEAVFVILVTHVAVIRIGICIIVRGLSTPTDRLQADGLRKFHQIQLFEITWAVKVVKGTVIHYPLPHHWKLQRQVFQDFDESRDVHFVTLFGRPKHTVLGMQQMKSHLR